MKRLSIIAIGILFIFSCTPKESEVSKNSDWDQFKLKGNVKSFREIKFLAVDNFTIVSNGEKTNHIYNKEVSNAHSHKPVAFSTHSTVKKAARRGTPPEPALSQ